MRTCVFCGGLPLTREHVYPRWLQQFPGPQEFIMREGSYQPAFPQAVVRENAQGDYVEVDEYRGNRTPNLHEVTVKVVCASCNNGWMSALESSVGAPLKKMADSPSPVPHLVNADVKTLLAAWAYKCFLMYDQYRDSRDRVFVKEDFVDFKSSKRPPRNARIYMGLTNSPLATISMWHETHLLDLSSHSDPQKVLATNPRNLASSSLGVQGVFFVQQYFKPDIVWTPPARRTIDVPAMVAVAGTPVHQIWPPSSRALNWPLEVASHKQFEDARLALFRVMNSLPKLAKKARGLD